ncbi:MAG: PKD domain-containing protein [Nanoarchaeota archaeon]|nr:PKD domain-containing protein [Nanoarchaeota archaeon]
MKVVTSILLLFCLLIGISSAAIVVYSSTLQKSYFYMEPISGKVNLTISGENLDQKIKSSRGDEISLENFFEWNGADYTCSPLDCSSGYESLSEEASKTINLPSGEDSYFGIVLEGNNVFLKDLSFDIESDFNGGEERPLAINFFEGTPWKFSNYSETFSSKNWGCYSPSSAAPGPLIRTSKYCELISLKETGAVKIGVVVNMSDSKNLRMSIYPREGGSLLGSNLFNPLNKDGVVIDAEYGTTFSEGEYQVCVSSDEPTNYTLYSETNGNNCGFVYDGNSPSNSTKDYAIFASVAQYEDASLLDSSLFNLKKLASEADDLLETKYSRDCSNKCFLPIKISGVPQNITISNVIVETTISGEDQVNRKIHQLKVIPSKVTFLGILDLELTGFKALNSGNYKITLGDKILSEQNIILLPSPIVTTLNPQDPPAGVPVKFFAGVSFGGDKDSLTYSWDFGDGTKAETKNNTMVHTYAQISNYSLEIQVRAGNLTSEKKFLINTISPKDAINKTLNSKKEILNRVMSDIDLLPEWYGKELKKIAEVDALSGELDRLIRARGNAYTDEDYLKIAKDLYQLDIPTEIFSKKEIAIKLIDSPEEINPSAIASFAGGVNQEYVDEYKQAIINWQALNTDSRISSDTFSLTKSSGVAEVVLRVYDVEVSSKDDYYESYLVINRPTDELYFEGDVSSRKVENSTLIIFNPNETKSFKFYYKDSEPTSFFISPKLSSLVIQETIDTSCNYNQFCEEDLGENSDNCRNDCKPVKEVIVYSILLFVFFIILYTLVHLWYRRNYENHLFQDRRQLYNLLMYISNERVRGTTNSRISRLLKQQGWSGEKVDYAMRKSLGKRTGLPEILPLTKISAYFRDRKSQKNIIATDSQQQIERNINKSRFQQPIRR